MEKNNTAFEVEIKKEHKIGTGKAVITPTTPIFADVDEFEYPHTSNRGTADHETLIMSIF